MMQSIFNRLWNASPRSTAAAVARVLDGARARPGPQWERIVAGPLAGRELLLARTANGAWVDMIEGRYDAALYGALPTIVPAGAACWDVGAHIGYHALGFAARDPRASVVAVEPNPANLARLRANLGRNRDLAARIEVLSIAVAERAGELAFASSDNVDDGSSSCGFLAGSDPPLDGARYEAFPRTVVPVRTLDDLAADQDRVRPALVKVDVEGAEVMVLEGAAGLLAARQTAWLIEVHTIALLFDTYRILSAAGYRLSLVEAHTQSRCLILAVPDGAAGA